VRFGLDPTFGFNHIDVNTAKGEKLEISCTATAFKRDMPIIIYWQKATGIDKPLVIKH